MHEPSRIERMKHWMAEHAGVIGVALGVVPILLVVFLAQPTPAGTRFATAAAVTAAILAGSHIVRVHDVAEMHAAVVIADEIAKSSTLQPSLP